MAATNGIRVYTQLADKAANDVSLFYSRRGNGPIYRWSYEAAIKTRTGKTIEAAVNADGTAHKED